MASATVGVHVHAEPARLLQTLDALTTALPPGAEVVLLPDGPDAETTEALARISVLRALRQWATASPEGPPACFNRLAARAGTDVVVLLESGARPAPDALVRLLRALESSPDVGLAGPSTNRSWNEQGVLPAVSGTAAGLAAAARTLRRRYGDGVRPLGPLHSLADFCLAVRSDVLEAVGAADEGFGLGPCWEMEYNVRAARAGFTGVWVGASFVHRAPVTRRRRLEEPRRFEASRRRYQDRLCGLRLDGAPAGYRPHCRGDACEHFAPANRIEVRIPLPGRPVEEAAPRPRVRVGAPLVTCVMPTADRPDFVAQAVRYLRRQEHLAWELVVVDDGARSTRELLALDDDPRIHWVRQPHSTSIGCKRNVGCERARGEFIAHWDDDDWHGSTRLRAQLEPLVADTADVCALRDAVWFDVSTWRFRAPTPSLHRSLFVEDVHGGTLVYRRSVWERSRGYPDRSLAEDAVFLQAAVRRGNRLAALPAAGLFVYIRHGANTWQVRGRVGDGARGWLDVPEPEELAGDRDFYAALAGAVAPTGRAPAAEPLVSCLMPTADRRAFVPSAIRCFLDQTYASRELVVVDDGADPVQDLLPDDARVRYVRLPRRTVLGRKRNIAAEASTGDLLVHWDDDDWSHPARLARQAAALCGSAEVCGLDEVLWWQPDGPRAWRYRYRGRRAWVAGNTLAYRREVWRRSPFRPQSVGEDTSFLWAAAPSVLPLHDLSLVVGTIHERNTSPKVTSHPGWSPVPPETVLHIVRGSPAWPPAGQASCLGP